MINPNLVTCKTCRYAMRAWALNWRQVKKTDAILAGVCIKAAAGFRDGPCFHNNHQRLFAAQTLKAGN